MTWCVFEDSTHPTSTLSWLFKVAMGESADHTSFSEG